MEQELKFELDLSRLAVLKKKGLGGLLMSNFRVWFFHVFRVKKNVEIFLKTL